MPTVASYCTTFLKPEMLHIYRQITGLKRWETFVITRERLCEDLYPMPPRGIEVAPKVRSNFVRRFWLKYVKREPAIVYRGEYGVLAKLLTRREADVLHVYFGHTGVHLLPFLKRWPKPSVVSFHGMDVQKRAHYPSYEVRLRELLQTVTLVLARSHSLQDRLLELGCPPEKLRLNRTGIPLDQFPRIDRQPPAAGAWHFVQACRLMDKKGLDDAIRAFAQFVETHPQAVFTIAGEGPLLEPLEKLRDELGLAGKVRFAGFLKGGDLCKLYHTAHVFIHPSRLMADGNQEGIPNAMLEAMATGLPVIATLHGGIPEAVRKDVTGFLVPERDVGGLHASMLRMLEAPGVWQAMGAAAAADVQENFEAGAQIAKLEAVYDEAWRLVRQPS
ncbi:MAG: glycosyl transferase [Verrucomicrobiaceae bacterium]|nr:glycosyl transferase [Verrucomicrobiaceae bacterium]